MMDAEDVRRNELVTKLEEFTTWAAELSTGDLETVLKITDTLRGAYEPEKPRIVYPY